MKNITIDRSVLKSGLQKSRTFKFLSSDEVDDVIELIETVKCKPEELVVGEGEISDRMFIVLDGSVSVLVDQMHEGEHKDVYICTLATGGIFGEAAVFMDLPRTASVVADGEVVLAAINRENFVKFIKTHPSSGVKVLMVVAFDLLSKLKNTNRELAYERKSVIDQGSIDDLIASLTG